MAAAAERIHLSQSAVTRSHHYASFIRISSLEFLKIGNREAQLDNSRRILLGGWM